MIIRNTFLILKSTLLTMAYIDSGKSMDCQNIYIDAFGYKINWTNRDDGWTERGRKKFLEFELRNKCSINIT